MLADTVPNDTLHDITTEFAMLGALMSESSILERIPFLHADHFYSAPHRSIFRAIQEEAGKGSVGNPLTLKRMAENHPDIAIAGGASYLVQAIKQAIPVLHQPIEHAKYIVELAQRRALTEACRKATAVLESSVASSPAEVAIALAKEFEDVSRGFGGPDLRDDFEVTEQILESLKKGSLPQSTGISKLDRCMDGGLFPSKAYGFAAKKKVGKTILASTISCNLNLAGVRHLFVCGEMSPQEVHQRNLSRLTGSFPSAFRSSYGQSPEFHRKVADAALMSKRCILYHNAPSLTFDELRRVVVTSILQKKVKGFILDYWQLVGGKSPKKNTSEHLDEVAQWIADTCRKYDVWAVVMAQINQEGNTRGGEGIRLAFDQVYQIKAPNEDNGVPYRWLEMMDTRYTAWLNLGDDANPGLFMNEKGPYFEETA